MAGIREQSDRLIRLDVTNPSVSVEALPAAWAALGGRALSARILGEECDPRCDPLGPDSVLVFAPGLLAGTAAPTSGRLSLGAKSPLTHGIQEADSGGSPAQHLAKLGYRALIVTGQPEDREARCGLEVDGRGARLVPADELRDVWNYATCAERARAHAETASFISCGPAGELRLSGASVACADQDNRCPTRHAACGGPGAVMGSKGLKLITVDPDKSRARQGARQQDVIRLCKDFSRAYLAGCSVGCSNVVHDREGNYSSSALEFETLILLGANSVVSSWEDFADLDRLCDEFGLDKSETGAALGVLMDAGDMDWGGVEAMEDALQQVAQATDLGRAIGNGAAAVGHHTGHHRVPAVEGQAIPAWAPRPLEATGVTYATSSMGLDLSREDLVEYGWRRLSDEWGFNRRAGFTRRDDDLPRYMKEGPIGPAKVVFDVESEVIADARVRKSEVPAVFFTSSAIG